MSEELKCLCGTVYNSRARETCPHCGVQSSFAAPVGSALTEAANRALARFANNKHVDTFDGSFWKTCAWAMADDLKRALTPNNASATPVADPKTNQNER
jgi:hypothetical protein